MLTRVKSEYSMKGSILLSLSCCRVFQATGMVGVASRIGSTTYKDSIEYCHSQQRRSYNGVAASVVSDLSGMKMACHHCRMEWPVLLCSPPQGL